MVNVGEKISYHKNLKNSAPKNIFFDYSKPKNHWSCITHLNAEDMLKLVVIEEKKFKNIESEKLKPRSMNDHDLWYS